MWTRLDSVFLHNGFSVNLSSENIVLRAYLHNTNSLTKSLRRRTKAVACGICAVCFVPNTIYCTPTSILKLFVSVVYIKVVSFNATRRYFFCTHGLMQRAVEQTMTTAFSRIFDQFTCSVKAHQKTKQKPLTHTPSAGPTPSILFFFFAVPAR